VALSGSATAGRVAKALGLRWHNRRETRSFRYSGRSSSKYVRRIIKLPDELAYSTLETSQSISCFANEVAFTTQPTTTTTTGTASPIHRHRDRDSHGHGHNQSATASDSDGDADAGMVYDQDELVLGIAPSRFKFKLHNFKLKAAADRIQHHHRDHHDHASDLDDLQLEVQFACSNCPSR
jgi:hypothetical protein